MFSLSACYGILRSAAMYYGVPFRQRRLARFYARFVRPGDLCFDVGAHLGNRTRALLMAGARVVAVEPQPIFAGLLRRWYGTHPRVTVVEQAVGAARGEADLLVSQRTPTVSTLSTEWAAEVRKTSSFARVSWEATTPVVVTTLDALIDQHGQPAFCKIDVEGYELEVLRGLNVPISLISFEYLPASIDIALRSLDRLAQISDYVFNLVVGEAAHLQHPEWLRRAQIARQMRALPVDARSGDVYACLKA